MKVLLVIDMLNDFIDEKGALYCGRTAKDIVPFIKSRIDEYRKNGHYIIWLQDAHEEDDKEFARFPKHAVVNTWGMQIIPELGLDVRDQEFIIRKRRYSGFYNTGLEPLLRTINPPIISEKVEVVGVCTSICVMDTVGGLVNRDYKVIVPRAGVADFDQDNHESALKRMETLYGAYIMGFLPDDN